MRKSSLTIILVFVVLSVLLSSCFLARGILGVKTPSPKTEKQVLKKARKFHFDEFPMLFTTDTGTIRYWVTDRLRTVDSASNKFDPLIFKHGDMVIPVETRYYTMGEIVLKGKNSKVKICESILTKVNLPALLVQHLSP